MAFKRYDGLYSKSLQEKFDNEMAVCPFCGENPHWLLDLKSGLTKGTVTCMCEKCGAKLYTEGTVSGWSDDLRVTDVGSRNINKLAVNSTYNVKTLGNISAYADTAETDGQCVAVSPSVPTATQSGEVAKPLYKNKWVWVAGVATVLTIALVILAVFTLLVPSCRENQKKTFAEEAAIQVISDNLKSPSTAIWNEVSYMENNDEGLYIVFVDVEAQNSFGGYVRNKYFVVIKNVDVKKKTFSYNRLYYCIECSGKDDTLNLNLIKDLNKYNVEPEEDSCNSQAFSNAYKIGAVL